MAKRKKTRHKKGTVVVWVRNNMLRLRWRYDGKQRHLALGLSDTPINRQVAERVAAEIARDIAYEQFDVTLASYRLDKTPATSASKLPTTVELFQSFIDHKLASGVSEQTICYRYRSLLANIKRFGKDVKTVDDARALVNLLRSRQSASTANKNLGTLKDFGRWLVHGGYMEESPFAPIESLKALKTKPQTHDVFTVDEVNALLTAFRTDGRCSWFYDFCVVLFSLGLRPSEAIGLRWQHIDLKRKHVNICESLIPADASRSGYQRLRKSTKTGNVRVLPLNERLIVLFAERKPSDADPDDLVFTMVDGKPISDRYFRMRCWQPMCEKAGIPYRPPYTARHTCLSHGIEFKGWTLPQAAQIAGHTTTKMVAETYAHMIQMPELPDYV